MGKETLQRPDAVPVSVWDGMNDEARAFVIVLVQQVEQLQRRVNELERRVGINSGNSSLPPSTDRPGEKPQRKPRTLSGKKRGGQPGHPKAERSLIPTEQCDRVVHHKPDACERCGAVLVGEDPEPVRKQVIDLPPVRPTVTEHQIHMLVCRRCGAMTAGTLPEHVPRGWFGPQVVAAVMLLTSLGRLSHRIMAELLERLFGLEVSVGQISRLQRIGREALQPGIDEITTAVRTSEVVNIDETGWRENGRRAWLWTVVGRAATLFAVRASRSRKVVHELLGETFAGIVGSDRYSAYSDLPDERHQFCWAHLLRDFQALIDRGGASTRIGTRLKSAGQELIHHWNRLRDGDIVRPTFQRHYRRLRDEIVSTLEAGSRCRNPQTAELCRTLGNPCYSLFLFAEVDGVAPTNNVSEQSLRRAVIFRKLCFSTERGSGSDVLAATFSVVETCRRLGRDAHTYLQQAVTAHFQKRHAPQLIIHNP
jgi:transposase